MGAALLEPVPLWEWAARRRGHPGFAVALVALAALGGLVVAAATEIGVRWFNTDWNHVAGYTPQPDRGWAPFATLALAATALPIAQGLIGAWLLPLYGRRRDWTGGLAVGVLGSLPIYVVAPALVVLPGIMLLCIAFLVSCAWWGSGARLVLGIPTGESSDHVAASIVAAAFALTIASAALPIG
ncbi:MAG TPA: hypothetical protein VFX81_08220 [Burkholderiaceae bacterium]|nr:hypothetical protein [Burkholderiaceae bacterium]